MKCTALRSATTKTTHPQPHPLSSNITTHPLSNRRRHHQFYGLPATMRASWLGRETSHPAYPRNQHPLPVDAPHDPFYSTRACLPDHSLPHFQLHRRPCTPNPHIPFRPRDPPSAPTHPFTINQQADLALPLRPLRPIPSPHPSLARTSVLVSYHRPRCHTLPNPP